MDKLSVKEYEDPFKKKMNKALSGLAKEAKTIRFEQSENQRLEMLVGITRAYSP